MNHEKRKIGRPKRVDTIDESLPAWDCKSMAKQVQAILDALEAPAVDKPTKLTLQRYFYRRQKYGKMFRDQWGDDARGYVTTLVRTITESSGNADALIEPVVVAVASCMRPMWVDRGLAWIAAFDQIPLRDTLNKLRELDLFDDQELAHFFKLRIWRKLSEIFGPDEVVPEPQKAKGRSKLARPKGVSERAWDDVLALRKSNRRTASRNQVRHS